MATIIRHHAHEGTTPRDVVLFSKERHVTDLTWHIRVPASHLENSTWQSAPGNAYLKRTETPWGSRSIANDPLGLEI